MAPLRKEQDVSRQSVCLQTFILSRKTFSLNSLPLEAEETEVIVGFSADAVSGILG